MLNFFTLLTQKHIPGRKKKHKGHKQYDLLVSVNTMLHISLNFPRILVLKHTSKTWKAWERDRGYSTFPSCRHKNKYSTRTQKTRTGVRDLLPNYNIIPNVHSSSSDINQISIETLLVTIYHYNIFLTPNHRLSHSIK